MVSIPPGVLTGVITGVIALAGVVYTQARTVRIERKRWVREDERLRQERDWNRELWARDQRREAHLTFLAEQLRLDQWATLYTRVGSEDGGVALSKPDPSWAHTLSRHLVEVSVFGSRDAATAAQRLFVATERIWSGAIGDMVRVDEARAEYRKAVQRDLGMSETDLPGWIEMRREP